MSATVSTPSRLHFGLLRFAQADGPSYGGLGMMIHEPRCVVTVERAAQWQATGPEAERALEFARRALAAVGSADGPAALHVNVASAVPQHRGLGGGTQLGLAIAAGVRRLLNMPPATAEELAAMTGRGLRSAVGTHGFLQGGLIWETGRPRGELLGRLALRVATPESWRIVLVTPRDASGLSGRPEREAFQQLAPVPRETTERLTRLAEGSILPATEAADLPAFGEALYQYGRLAGECFAAIQGGPYASAEVARCVELIRGWGVAGVGQSSWGPTAFAFVEDHAQAEDLTARLAVKLPTLDAEVRITRPDNRGAIVADDVA